MRTTALRRKLIYLVAMLAMLVPLFLLGQPSGGSGDSGGQLTEMRNRFNIAESDLGEISPASETMKLASLGMRGVAATLLWNKAHHYKVAHEWDRYKATLNNISLLQPHFDKVWEHQAHNLAYNVSTEFDDYRQRYEMVREGTEFLSKGVRQNRNAPRLVWYTGWFYGSKMGMSDEKVQFRKLFSDDEVLHGKLLEEGIAVDSPEARGPYFKPDNWLVGRLWLRHGYDIVDSGVKIRRQTPLNFYETGPKWRIKHSEAIEDEGVLDERAQNAWQMAAQDWQEFGQRSVPTTAAFTIKLGQLDELVRLKALRLEEFRKLTGEELPGIENQWQPNLMPYAKKAAPEDRMRAMELADEIEDIEERRVKTDGYRKQINYPYWDTLTQAEQEERTVEARRLIYEAEKANEEAELDKAIDLYEQAFAVWAEIFDDYPILTVDDSAEDLLRSIRRYSVAIDSEEMADDFPLAAFVEMMGTYEQVSSEVYEEVRKTQKERAEKRKQELAQLELERERQAAEEMEREREAMQKMKEKSEAKKAEQAAKAETNADDLQAGESMDNDADADADVDADEATSDEATADEAIKDDSDPDEPVAEENSENKDDQPVVEEVTDDAEADSDGDASDE
ncbi:hypothetical protein Q31b_15990 [Novipirellula aureliae]|uniref:IRE (Iron responsive element) n=1 Tax=Novipirellula aureliae TaxID=2527966 RepID=A0A5C6E657_9BACT|nr:IRE (iron responsive element) [Novipirellula aureliae]TWU44064.1 hypothetical protein Q31b_15990 [Novipirellula aureliae]